MVAPGPPPPPQKRVGVVHLLKTSWSVLGGHLTPQSPGRNGLQHFPDHQGRWSTAKEGCHSGRSGAPIPSGAQSPRITPHSGESIQPSVNSFPPHSPGARLLQWSPCGEQKQGPASTSTGLLESLDSKGEQGQERVTGGSDVDTPDWRRGRRLSNCCHVSPTTGAEVGSNEGTARARQEQ